VRRSLHIVPLVLVTAALFVPARAQAQFRYPPIYAPYRYLAPESDLRFNVKPKEAEVYVDGYFAGQVEDFNGAFQRLHVAPGQHDITVFMNGYHSLTQKLYLSPNSTRKIEGTLEKLNPGEPPEAAPQPSPDSRRRDDEFERVPPPGGPRPGPSTRRLPPPPPRDRPDRVPPASAGTSQSGTLSIRVQPSGATIFIDGERWTGPAGNDERLLVQVPEGRHKIEVERDGYERFVTDIDVRRMETAPVNVSLTRTR
jgi:PEGA domain-containing protein